MRGRKGEYRKLFRTCAGRASCACGSTAELRELAEDIELGKTKKHTIEVAGRPAGGQGQPGQAPRRLARDRAAAGRRPGAGRGARRRVDMLLERLACAECGISFPELGRACSRSTAPTARARPATASAPATRSIPSSSSPTPEDLCRRRAPPWAGPTASSIFSRRCAAREALRVRPRDAVERAPEETRDVILFGEPDDGFEGVVQLLERRYKETESEDTRDELESFMTAAVPGCGGARLRPESRGQGRGAGPSPTSRGSRSAAREFFADARPSPSARWRSPGGS